MTASASAAPGQSSSDSGTRTWHSPMPAHSACSIDDNGSNQPAAAAANWSRDSVSSKSRPSCLERHACTAGALRLGRRHRQPLAQRGLVTRVMQRVIACLAHHRFGEQLQPALQQRGLAHGRHRGATQESLAVLDGHHRKNGLVATDVDHDALPGLRMPCGKRHGRIDETLHRAAGGARHVAAARRVPGAKCASRPQATVARRGAPASHSASTSACAVNAGTQRGSRAAPGTSRASASPSCATHTSDSPTRDAVHQMSTGKLRLLSADRRSPGGNSSSASSSVASSAAGGSAGFAGAATEPRRRGRALAFLGEHQRPAGPAAPAARAVPSG